MTKRTRGRSVDQDSSSSGSASHVQLSEYEAEGMSMTVVQLKAWITEHDEEIPSRCKKKDLVDMYVSIRDQEETSKIQSHAKKVQSTPQKKGAFIDPSILASLKKSSRKSTPKPERIPSPNILSDGVRNSKSSSPSTPNEFQSARRTPSTGKSSQTNLGSNSVSQSSPISSFKLSSISQALKFPSFATPSGKSKKPSKDTPTTDEFSMSPSIFRKSTAKDYSVESSPVSKPSRSPSYNNQRDLPKRSPRKGSTSPTRTRLQFDSSSISQGHFYQRRSPTTEPSYSESDSSSSFPSQPSYAPQPTIRTHGSKSIKDRLILIIIVILSSIVIYQSSVFIKDIFHAPTYCDTYITPLDTDNCVACPRFATCSEGLFKTCEVGYEKKKSLCAKSDKAMKLAERMRNIIVRQLSTLKGSVECNESFDDGFLSHELSMDQISKFISKSFDESDPLYPIAVEDVFSNLSDHPSIHYSAETSTYSSTIPILSWKCQFAKVSGFIVMIAIVLFLVLFIYRKIRQDRRFGYWVRIVHQECLSKIQNVDPKFSLGYPVPFLKTAVFESLEISPDNGIWISAYELLVSDVRVRLLTRNVEGIQMECIQWMGSLR